MSIDLGVSLELSGAPLATLFAESSYSIDSIRRYGDQFHFIWLRFKERKGVCVTKVPNSFPKG